MQLLTTNTCSPKSHSSRKVLKCGQAQPFRLQTESRGQMKEQAFTRRLQEELAEEAKHRIPIAQGLPWTTDKPKVIPKPPAKEQTKPLEVKLHTQLRAVKRAGFNDLVSTKIHFLEQQRQQEEKLQKMIEEAEVRMLRKEMIPRAQLMPIFDRPFFPQRSTRPPTIPREPNFHLLSNCCWRCMSCNVLYGFQQTLHHNMKPIK